MLTKEEIKAKYPLGGRPKAFNSPDEMLEKLYAFLERQENRIVEVATKGGVETMISPAPITIEGFCAFAGITKTTFYDYAKKPKYRVMLAQFRQIVEKYFVEQCVEGKPGNKADFILKNAFADEWKEKSDVNLSGEVGGVTVRFVNMAGGAEEEKQESGGNDGGHANT